MNNNIQPPLNNVIFDKLSTAAKKSFFTTTERSELNEANKKTTLIELKDNNYFATLCKPMHYKPSILLLVKSQVTKNRTASQNFTCPDPPLRGGEKTTKIMELIEAVRLGRTVALPPSQGVNRGIRCHMHPAAFLLLLFFWRQKKSKEARWGTQARNWLQTTESRNKMQQMLSQSLDYQCLLSLCIRKT